MQTFLPYSSFFKSLACLDNKRLGKQRVEADQILKSLTLCDYGWKNHPAVKMWKGYEQALIIYRNIAINIWIIRGFKNSMPLLKVGKVYFPHWIGGPIHSSHRSNLLRKNISFYSSYRWLETPDIPYYWPV